MRHGHLLLAALIMALGLQTAKAADFKNTKAGPWDISDTVGSFGEECQMSVAKISKDWGFEVDLLDDEKGPLIDLEVGGNADNVSLDTVTNNVDPKATSATATIDAQAFPGDATVTTTVGVVTYDVRYRGAAAEQLIARLQSNPRSIRIAVPGQNFIIPTSNFSKALASVEQCYPLSLGHPLKWK